MPHSLGFDALAPELCRKCVKSGGEYAKPAAQEIDTSLRLLALLQTSIMAMQSTLHNPCAFPPTRARSRIGQAPRLVLVVPIVMAAENTLL